MHFLPRIQLTSSHNMNHTSLASQHTAGGSHVATRADSKGRATVGGEMFAANPHVLVKFRCCPLPLRPSQSSLLLALLCPHTSRASGEGSRVSLRVIITRPEGYWAPVRANRPARHLSSMLSQTSRATGSHPQASRRHVWGVRV